MEQLTLEGAAAAPDDEIRQGTVFRAVLDVMSDGRWHTLRELSRLTGGSEAAVSARLRDLRKARYGAHDVERRRDPDGNGLHHYRLAR